MPRWYAKTVWLCKGCLQACAGTWPWLQHAAHLLMPGSRAYKLQDVMMTTVQRMLPSTMVVLCIRLHVRPSTLSEPRSTTFYALC